MDNFKKMTDYFFSSQNIEITEFHEIENKSNTLMFLDTRFKSSDVVNHQIVRFKFEKSSKSNEILIATVAYIYDNGIKSGLYFNNDLLVEKMKLGQKCISVLDKLNIKHYYPAMYFTLEMNTTDNTISMTNCYQSINLIITHGTSYHLLEDLVIDIIKKHFEKWHVDTVDIPLSDLIDIYFMAKI